MKYVINKLKELTLKMDTRNNELTIKECALLFKDPEHFIKITAKEIITYLLMGNEERKETLTFLISFKKRVPLHPDEIKQFDKIINVFNKIKQKEV